MPDCTREYGTEWRSGNTATEQWHYVVTGLTSGTATINWSGFNTIPTGYRLVLKDQGTKKEVDLRRTSSYTFTVGGESQRDFLITLTNSSIEALRITDIQILPNPFAPLRESVVVRYRLSTDATVNVKIYDWVGNLVYVVSPVNSSAGFVNEFTWNGRNNLGRMVGNGIYFAKISAVSGNNQVSQILKIAVVN
jgi:hypothetical protein